MTTTTTTTTTTRTPSTTTMTKTTTTTMEPFRLGICLSMETYMDTDSAVNQIPKVQIPSFPWLPNLNLTSTFSLASLVKGAAGIVSFRFWGWGERYGDGWGGGVCWSLPDLEPNKKLELHESTAFSSECFARLTHNDHGRSCGLIRPY